MLKILGWINDKCIKKRWWVRHPNRYIFAFLCCGFYLYRLSKHNFLVFKIELIKILGFIFSGDQQKNNIEFFEAGFLGVQHRKLWFVYNFWGLKYQDQIVSVFQVYLQHSCLDFFVATKQNLKIILYIDSHSSKNDYKEEIPRNSERRFIKFVDEKWYSKRARV